MAADVHRVELIMGTAITLDIVDAPSDVDADRLAEDAFVWFREIDDRFSTYKPESEVSRIDRGELPIAAASAQMAHVIEACEELREATGGYFDAYASRHFDPSGYVKGWSVQVAADRLLAAGATNHCINAGGDIRLHGVGRDGDAWRIGIAHPWELDKVAWVLAGVDLAIATSGTYERGLHVIDPYRGEPATFLRSVTVTGPDLAIADAYATAALAMGARGIDWLAALEGYECAVVTEAGDAYRSDGLPTVVATLPTNDADQPPY